MSRRLLIISIPRLNEVFMGGVAPSSMIHIYGRYQTGKSLLALQILYEWVSSGFGSALVLDSEHSFYNNFSKTWMERFAKRFGVEVEMVRLSKEKYRVQGGKRRYLNDIRNVMMDVFGELGMEVDETYLRRVLEYLLPQVELRPERAVDRAIYVYEVSGVEGLAEILGMKSSVKVGSKKIEASMDRTTDLETSPLANFIRSAGVKFILLDSLGGLMKNYIFHLQDFPTRAAILNVMLHSLGTLASSHDLIVFVSNHESRNPTTNYHSFYGGSAVGYGFKYVLYMRLEKDGYREVIGYRAPHMPEAGWRLRLRLDERGFTQDVDGEAD